ncbi:MAG: pyridoxal phosphate-dependent aminotransferase [Candidatus Howiella sp.]|jgi:histidinol-phosphate aminotransferase
MSYILNEKLADLTPYAVDTAGYPVRLDANESFLSLPDDLRREVAKAVSALAFNRYPDPKAERLCRAFAAYYGIGAENVVAGNGSDELLYILATCFTMAGDTIVTTVPDFSMYRFYGHLAECRSVVYNKMNLELEPDALIDLCQRERARLLIFSNPCNPTGRGLCRDAVRRVIEGVDALVVLDEAYMDFWDQSLLDEAGRHDNLIVLKTMSKAVGAAALRLGFAVTTPTLADALRAAKSPYNVNALSSAAGEVLYTHPGYLDDCRAKIVASRDALYRALLPLCARAGWRMSDSFANFLYIEMPEAESVFAFLQRAGVLVRCFDGALRITAGNEGENTALLTAVRAYLQEKRSVTPDASGAD